MQLQAVTRVLVATQAGTNKHDALVISMISAIELLLYAMRNNLIDEILEITRAEAQSIHGVWGNG